MAGAAALVIQAYREDPRRRHPDPGAGQADPVSTATDLGAPAEEQGAGLLNTYKAVQLAESIGDPPPAAQALTHLDATQLNAVGAPGHAAALAGRGHQHRRTTQTVNLSGRTFGPDQNVQTGSVTLSDAISPQFTNFQGLRTTTG